MTEAPRPGTSHSAPVTARTYQGHEAGIVSRLVAAALDLFAVAALLVATYAGATVLLFVLQPSNFAVPRLPAPFLGVAYLVVATLSLAVPWFLTGRSYGQRVMGLRVTTRAGTRLSLLRALARAVVCVCFPVGLLWALASPRGAAVHDVVVGTAVRYDWSGALSTPGSPRHAP
jgi:uncharacterized RDD family membrane protein YckC